MRGIALLAGLVAAGLLLGSCSSSGTSSPATRTQPPTTVTATRTTSASAAAPLSTGPTTAVGASRCPYVAKQSAADRVGMRLDRITVLRSGGRIVGCRLYALQNSALHESEHLPGPHQPAIEITTTRYASAVAAHNAFVLAARKGTHPQQATVSVDNTGVCYQIPFYGKDDGRDWTCGFSVGTTAVIVKTVVVSPALNVILVARDVAAALS